MDLRSVRRSTPEKSGLSARQRKGHLLRLDRGQDMGVAAGDARMMRSVDPGLDTSLRRVISEPRDVGPRERGRRRWSPIPAARSPETS